MSDVLNKVNQIGLNTDYPVAGQNNSSSGFRQNTRATLAGLTQASDELTKIQNTRFTFSGDAAGSSNVIGSAIQSGSNYSMEVAFTLANVLTGPITADTSTGDYTFSFDAKGRLTALSQTTYTVNFASGHTAGSEIPITGDNLGTGTGNIAFPVFTFNAQGRLQATSIKSIPYGLMNHTLTTNSIIIGKQNKSDVLNAPSSTRPHNLMFDGANVVWQEVVETEDSTGVTNVIGGNGITTSMSTDSATVSLDIAKMTAMDSINDVDVFAIHDVSDNTAKKVPFSLVKASVGKLNQDSSPSLAADLDVKNQVIYSSLPAGVNIQTSASSPAGRIRLTTLGISIQGSTNTPVAINAPQVAINGIIFPTTVGTSGQVLTKGNGVLEWKTPETTSDPLANVLFVANSGSNTTGNGSILKPYATLTQALSQVPNNSANLWTIMLMGGTYTESIAVQGKAKIAIEGMFSASPARFTNYIQIQDGVNEFYMSNIIWDLTNQPAGQDYSVFILQNGLERGTFRNCSFLREDATTEALSLYGQTTGPIKFLDCTIVGTIGNYLDLSEDGELLIHNVEEKIDYNIPINMVDQERTLNLKDVGRYLRVNVSTDNTILVPDQTEVPFKVGATIRITQTGAGRTSVAPKANAIINTPNGYVLRRRFSSATLTYVGSDIWDLSGDLDETIIIAPVIRADSDQISADSDQITVDNG